MLSAEPTSQCGHFFPPPYLPFLLRLLNSLGHLLTGWQPGSPFLRRVWALPSTMGPPESPAAAVVGSPQAKASAQRAQCAVSGQVDQSGLPFPTTIHALHTRAHTASQQGHSPRAGHVDLCCRAELFSDPWVGQMEEGDQEARVGKQLGLQRGCGLAVPGRRLTSVRAPTPPSLQRAAMGGGGDHRTGSCPSRRTWRSFGPISLAAWTW